MFEIILTLVLIIALPIITCLWAGIPIKTLFPTNHPIDHFISELRGINHYTNLKSNAINDIINLYPEVNHHLKKPRNSNNKLKFRFKINCFFSYIKLKHNQQRKMKQLIAEAKEEKKYYINEDGYFPNTTKLQFDLDGQEQWRWEESPNQDLLDEIITERTTQNPGFVDLLKEAEKKRSNL